MSDASKRARRVRRRAQRAYEARKRFEHTQLAYVAMAEHFCPTPPEPHTVRLCKALNAAGVKAVLQTDIFEGKVDPCDRSVKAIVCEEASSYGMTLRVDTDLGAIFVDVGAIEMSPGGHAYAANFVKRRLEHGWAL